MSDLRLNTNFINEAEEVIDLQAYVKILRKWRKLIIFITLLSVLTAAILSYFILPPVYEAQTLLLITQARDNQQIVQQKSDNLEGMVSTVSRLPEMTMKTYLGQLESENLFKRVIDKLKLDKDLYTPQGLLDKTEATVVKDSSLIEVSTQNTDPNLAATITNTLSQEYLQLISEKNQEQMTKSVTFLEQQGKATGEEIQGAVEALKKFQAEPRGVAVLEQVFVKKSEDLASYESQLQMASVDMQRLTAGIALLQQELAATPQMFSMRKVSDESTRSVTADEVNPVYVTLSQQLSEKKSLLAEKQAEKQGLQSAVDALRKELDKLQAELTGKKAQEDVLQAEVDRIKKNSETLAQKTAETKIAKSIDLGSTSVIVLSEASVPIKPVKPNKKLNMIIAFMLGLMVSVSLAFIFEHLDNAIKTPEDVVDHLELPVLGVIPVVTKLSEKSAYHGGQK